MANNFSEQDLNTMLTMVGKKLGKSPKELKDQLQSGSIEKMIGNLGENDSKKLQQILSNPTLAQQLLSTPQATQLLKKFVDGNSK